LQCCFEGHLYLHFYMVKVKYLATFKTALILTEMNSSFVIYYLEDLINYRH